MTVTRRVKLRVMASQTGGRIGAGAGATVGKLHGREHATRAGVGYAGLVLANGVTIAAIAVANAFGDVLAQDGTVLGGPHDDDGALLRSSELISLTPEPPARAAGPGENTTLVCVCTDASLDKRGCGIVARIASAGIARAVDPAFTPLDGDIIFCVAAGTEPAAAPGPDATWALTALGTVAATLTAAAIRDAITA